MVLMSQQYATILTRLGPVCSKSLLLLIQYENVIDLKYYILPVFKKNIDIATYLIHSYRLDILKGSGY